MAEPQPAQNSVHCPECGALLSASRLDGLCPVCLLEETSPTPAGSADPAAAAPSLMFLPGYQLIREIARGGMGIIYEASQFSPSRTVAIKMLLPHLMDDEAMRERFRREAQAMASLDHQGILPVYEVGDHNGLPYFSMKLAAGGTLSDQAWRYRGNWLTIAALIADLSDAIQMAHSHGVLHRDLKPANILFDELGRAYLSDFGIAKQLAADPAGLDLTKSATLLGTPNYLPPEWAAGTARSPTTAGDVYGIGAILYQLLTGDPPHHAHQLTTLLRQIADQPVTAPRQVDPTVPRDLEIICLKALAKDPDHRYPSAHEMAEDLRLWLAGRPIRARPASRVERIWRWSRRNPLPASLAALLATALTVGGAALWKSLQTSRHNLQSSLVAQASALRETGRLGNRTQAIGALDQAIRLRPSQEAQVELTSALAMTDLRESQRFSYGTGNRVHTDAAFTCYTFVDSHRRLTVRRLADEAVLSSVPNDIIDPEGFGPFSPDGRFLCLRPAGQTLFSIWDCHEHVFRQQGIPGSYLLFAPDSRTLAIGHKDGRLTLMDAITGANHATHSTDLTLIRPYSFSPDGTRLVTGQFKESKFLVIDIGSGQTVLRGELPPAAHVRCAVWKPDSSGFFIGTESFKIYEWSIADNSLPRQYTGHQGNIFALAIHPDGEWLLSQSEDGTTRLWNTASAQTVAQLPYYGSEVRFSGDGRRLLCEDREAQSVHLLELAPASVCRQFPIPHPDQDRIGTRGCWFITFSPDGGLLSVGDTDGIMHFDGQTGQSRGRGYTGYCWSLGWTDDGSALYSVSMAGLQRWPVHHKSHPAPPGSPPGAEGASRSEPPQEWTLLPPERWPTDYPNSNRPARTMNHLSISSGARKLALAYDDQISLLNLSEGQTMGSFPTVEFLLDSIALNSGGTLVAASQQKGPGLLVWDTTDRTRLHQLPTQFPEATVRFHPDGIRLFSGDLSALSCWNAQSGSLIWRFPCPARSPITVQLALTPDGTLLAANLTPETISLIDPATGREITRLRHPSPHSISGLAFSPDHSRLAALCLGHLVQLWDLHRLREELSARSIDWPHPPLPQRQLPLVWTLPP